MEDFRSAKGVQMRKIGEFDLQNPAHLSAFRKELDSLLSSPSISQTLHAWLVDLRSNTFHPYFWNDAADSSPSPLTLRQPIHPGDLKALNTLSQKIPGFSFTYAENRFSDSYQLSVSLALSDKSKSDLQKRPRNPMAETLRADAVYTSQSRYAAMGAPKEYVVAELKGELDTPTGPQITMPGRTPKPRPKLVIDDVGYYPYLEAKQARLDAQIADFYKMQKEANAAQINPIAIPIHTAIAPENLRNLDEGDTQMLTLVLDLFLPWSTGENLIGKINRGEPISEALAVFALDAIASIIKYKALVKIAKAKSAFKLLKDAEFVSTFDAQMERAFVRTAAKDIPEDVAKRFAARTAAKDIPADVAKRFAARRLAMRKFITEPEKWFVKGNPVKSAENLAARSIAQAEKYGTKSASKRLIPLYRTTGTVSTIGQKTLNVLHWGMMGMFAYDAANNISRSVEVALSDKVPAWAEDLDPEMKGKPEAEKRQRAMFALKRDFAMFWGIFMGVGYGAGFVTRKAPDLSKAFLQAVKARAEGTPASKIVPTLAKWLEKAGIRAADSRAIADGLMPSVEATAPKVRKALFDLNTGTMVLAGTVFVITDPEILTGLLELVPENMRNNESYKSLESFAQNLEDGPFNMRRNWNTQTNEFLAHKAEKEILFDSNPAVPLDESGKSVANAEAEKEKNIKAMGKKDQSGMTLHLRLSNLIALNPSVEDKDIRESYNNQIYYIMDNEGLDVDGWQSLCNNVFKPAADRMGVTTSEKIGVDNSDLHTTATEFASHFNTGRAEALLAKYEAQPFIFYYDALKLADRWLAPTIPSEVPTTTLATMQQDLGNIPISGAMQDEWKNSVLTLSPGDAQRSQALYVIFKYMLKGYIQHDILEKAQSAAGAGISGRGQP